MFYINERGCPESSNPCKEDVRSPKKSYIFLPASYSQGETKQVNLAGYILLAYFSSNISHQDHLDHCSVTHDAPELEELSWHYPLVTSKVTTHSNTGDH